MNSQLVLTLFGPQLNLSQDLIGEGVAHDKAGMTVSTAQIDQTALCQQDDVAPVLQRVPVNLQYKAK